MAASKKVLVPVLLLMMVGIGVGAWYAFGRAHSQDGAIRVSGNIECVEVGVAFKIAGRVERRPIDEGERVYQSQTLIGQLDTLDLEADVALRRAELRAAQAALSELEAGSRVEEIGSARALMEKAWAHKADLESGSRPQEIETAKAALAAAAADRDRLLSELNRAEQLLYQKTITKEQFDQARAAYDVAEARRRQALEQYNLVREGPKQQQIDEARAAFRQAEAQYWLVENGPRPETIEQARAKVEQARAALKLAETRLGYATVRSPLTGVVLSKNIEPGEYVAPGTPVVTVADIENVWLRAYIDERDLGSKRVTLGQEVEVTTDAYPDKVYKGRISFISSEAEFTPKQVQTEKERTRLVYRIKIDIKNSDRELKPGMPADARIP